MIKVNRQFHLRQGSQRKTSSYPENQNLWLSPKTDLNSGLTGPQDRKQDFLLISGKTGSLLGEFTKGRSVLNMFGYTGGFSVYAMKDAALVHSVDSSASATRTG